MAMDKAANVVLDIENLAQSLDKCSGSPKLTKALSRNRSYRVDKKNGEEQEADEASKKLVVKVMSSPLEPLISNKPLVLVTSASNSCSLSDACDGRSKRFSRFVTVHPREILFIFAAL